VNLEIQVLNDTGMTGSGTPRATTRHPPPRGPPSTQSADAILNRAAGTSSTRQRTRSPSHRTSCGARYQPLNEPRTEQVDRRRARGRPRQPRPSLTKTHRCRHAMNDKAASSGLSLLIPRLPSMSPRRRRARTCLAGCGAVVKTWVPGTADARPRRHGVRPEVRYSRWRAVCNRGRGSRNGLGAFAQTRGTRGNHDSKSVTTFLHRCATLFPPGRNAGATTNTVRRRFQSILPSSTAPANWSKCRATHVVTRDRQQQSVTFTRTSTDGIAGLRRSPQLTRHRAHAQVNTVSLNGAQQSFTFVNRYHFVAPAERRASTSADLARHLESNAR